MNATEKNMPVTLGGVQAYSKPLFNKGIGNKGTCSTAASTLAKSVTLGTTFELTPGAMILVTFANGISVAGSTLSVIHTDLDGVQTVEDAKPIQMNGAALDADIVVEGASVLMFYSGTAWEIVGSMGSNEKVTGTIQVALEAYVNNAKTQGADLEGAVITLTNTTSSQSYTYTLLAGETSHAFDSLTPLENYQVSVVLASGHSGDYTQPAAQTVTSLGIGAQVTKTFVFEGDEYTVSTNQSGSTVTVLGTAYNNGDTLRVAKGTDIGTPTASYVKGYSVSVTTTGKTITATYSTTPITVTIESNQADDTTISALRATVAWTYDGHSESETLASASESINIPTGVTPTVTFPAAPTGYSKSENGYTATYSTEIVGISLTKDQGEGDLTNVSISVLDANDNEIGNGTGSISNLKIASGTVYHIALSNSPSGYTLPDLTTEYTAASTTNASRAISLEYTEITEVAISSYIINQTNPSAAAASMIEIDTPAKDNNDNDSVIHRIHSNTKLYGAAQSLSNGSLQVKEISRSNKALFTDGTSVTASSYDVFMKLPEFWWKVTELATDKYQVSFTMDASTGSGSGWNHWEGDTFIGCYEALCQDTNNNTTGVLYSRSGATPTVSVSQANFKTKARNKGTGYQIVTYEAHCIMALLGYGWLGTTDDQSVVGFGTSSYPKTTGGCNAKGMNDTVHGVDGESGSINFWGLENWWGDLYEWVDNVETTNSSGGIKIMDRSGSTTRTATAGTTNYGCIGKMVLGQYGDMIPKEVHSDGNYTTGFASYGYVYGSAGYVAYRSYSESVANGGLGCLRVDDSSSVTRGAVGSRLLYKGSYTIV